MNQILSKTINQFKYSKINDSSITGEDKEAACENIVNSKTMLDWSWSKTTC